MIRKKNKQAEDTYVDFTQVKSSFTSDYNKPYKSKINSKQSSKQTGRVNPFKEKRKTTSILDTYSKICSPRHFKIVGILFLVLLLYFLYQPLTSAIYSYLFQYPTIAALVSDISRELLNKTLKGLFIVSFIGSLFFISLPGELIFLQYLQTSTNTILLIATIVISNMLGMITNYGIGYLLGQNLLRKWLKDKYEKYENSTLKWGGIVLFIGNIIPGPIELIALLFGATKYPLKQFIYIVSIARVIKYTLLVILAIQFPDIVKYVLF